MRFIITLLLIALAGALAEWTLATWWTAAVVAGICGLFSRLRIGSAFWAGFCGVALVWLAFFLWHDLGNDHLLSRKLAELFHLPSYIFYLIVTLLLGGLTGGLSCWAGAHLSRMFHPVAQ